MGQVSTKGLPFEILFPVLTTRDSEAKEVRQREELKHEEHPTLSIEDVLNKLLDRVRNTFPGRGVKSQLSEARRPLVLHTGKGRPRVFL